MPDIFAALPNGTLVVPAATAEPKLGYCYILDRAAPFEAGAQSHERVALSVLNNVATILINSSVRALTPAERATAISVAEEHERALSVLAASSTSEEAIQWDGMPDALTSEQLANLQPGQLVCRTNRTFSNILTADTFLVLAKPKRDSIKPIMIECYSLYYGSHRLYSTHVGVFPAHKAAHAAARLQTTLRLLREAPAIGHDTLELIAATEEHGMELFEGVNK